jgi:hypothetical protein
LHLYSAYGLTLASALSLPDLVSGRGRADVLISLEPPARPTTEDIAGIQCVAAAPGRAQLSWHAVGQLLVQDGSRIVITPAPDADEEALRLFVVGAGFGVLLHQRGLLVLHGSAVVLRERAIAFLGGKGWGKSTTAMAMSQRGHAVISDELLAIRYVGDNQAVVLPGSSPLKLWSDALSSLGGDPRTAAPVRPGLDKYFVAEAGMVERETPLRRIYLLAAGDMLAMKPVSPNEAFFGVVPHVYVARFGTGFLQATDGVRTFTQLHELLTRVSVVKLQRRRDLNELSQIAELIELHDLQGPSA